eukprot:CCRYP_012288-RA/>CCRYP_012288-RA protein AED:0.12 eAED:0.32 QI:0/0/0/1/0.33/0.25/4/0/520
MANELQSTHEATQRVVKILDANYKKADLQSIVSTNCTHLSLQDQNSLLELLTEFEELFDGTLDGTVCFLTDFREVNKRLVRKPFPLPKISTVRQELEGFTYATTLDLSMGYYTIRLDPDSSKICTLIFPWGKYSYLRLPMGIAGSPDIFQAKMSTLMGALEFVRAYLDDLLYITKANLEDHLDKLKMVLTPESRKGTGDSRDFIAKNVKDLRKFLGMVQYYRDLWARCSKVLAPLTSLVGECGHTKVTRANKTKKRPWYWDTVHRKAFNDVKTSIAKDVVLAYPNYSREFEIYTDALSKQLGSVITQGNRPLAFFSRKMLTTQQKYSMTELELLAIVETLKEFKGMLWGQRFKVYTDHKNLIQDALGLTSDRVYRWRLLLEEFGPKIVYIKGIHNTVADAISRLDIGPIPSEHKNQMTFTKCWCHYTMQEESAIDTSAYQEEMNLVFANRSEEDVIYPLTVREIAEAQKLDASLKTLKDKYSTQLVESTQLLCKDGKAVIPNELQHRSLVPPLSTAPWTH